MDGTGLVEIKALDPSIRLDIKYARTDNFMGRVLYPSGVALLQQPAAKALMRVNASLRERGLGLVVYDAYRPYSVTCAMWDETPEAQRKFVANPAEGSKHNRGCAVDVTLCDSSSGVVLPMPSEFDEFSDRAYADYGGGSVAERYNRKTLRDAMQREGFSVNPREWWERHPVLDVPLPVPVTIALVADTHGCLAPRLCQALADAKVTHILHAGDVGPGCKAQEKNRPDARSLLAKLSEGTGGIAVDAVRGNTDDEHDRGPELPATLVHEAGAVRFVVHHGDLIPHKKDKKDNDDGVLAALKPKVGDWRPTGDIVVYGHSHKPRFARHASGVCFLNPGTAGDSSETSDSVSIFLSRLLSCAAAARPSTSVRLICRQERSASGRKASHLRVPR